MRDTEAWEIGAAINQQTAAICYVANARAQPPLSAVVDVAHAAGVPVIVDAAAQMPPASNLLHFIAEGADLVAFSGGKAIRGPQASGILCGRRDLIQAAALQHLDMDILWEQWNPPSGFIDKEQLPGATQHGIGRPCKVGKEEIVGLLTALRLFVDEDPATRCGQWDELMESLRQALDGIPGIEVRLNRDPKRPEIPAVHVHLDEEKLGTTAMDLVRQLQDGDPGIHASPGMVRDAIVGFGPVCLKPEEPAIIARRVRQILTGAE